MYSSWKAHGTVPTYWFEKDPLRIYLLVSVPSILTLRYLLSKMVRFFLAQPTRLLWTPGGWETKPNLQGWRCSIPSDGIWDVAWPGPLFTWKKWWQHKERCLGRWKCRIFFWGFHVTKLNKRLVIVVWNTGGRLRFHYTLDSFIKMIH